MVKFCDVCGKKFKAKASKKYCSNECAREGKRMKEEERVKAIYPTGNISKIKKVNGLAAEYGISYGKYMAKRENGNEMQSQNVR